MGALSMVLMDMSQDHTTSEILMGATELSTMLLTRVDSVPRSRPTNQEPRVTTLRPHIPHLPLESRFHLVTMDMVEAMVEAMVEDMVEAMEEAMEEASVEELEEAFSDEDI